MVAVKMVWADFGADFSGFQKSLKILVLEVDIYIRLIFRYIFKFEKTKIPSIMAEILADFPVKSVQRPQAIFRGER